MQPQNMNPQGQPQVGPVQQQVGQGLPQVGQVGQQQVGQQAMQQNRMPEPPQVITTKDLAYLRDALSWELELVKKFHHFAQETQNPQVKNIIARAAQMHQRHYQILLKHLNPSNSASKIQQ